MGVWSWQGENDPDYISFVHSTGYAPYQVLSQSSTGIPHGPTPLPFFGNSFQLKKMVRNASQWIDSECYRKFCLLQGYVKFFEENYKKYGPVFR